MRKGEEPGRSEYAAMTRRVKIIEKVQHGRRGFLEGWEGGGIGRR